MPPSRPFLRRLAFIVAVAVASGTAWMVSWQVAQAALSFTQVRNGITLVYIPAGVRLVILLVSGFWGAVGIALAFPLALLQPFQDLTWQEIVTYSAIAAFVPYATIYAVCRAANISLDLGSLRSIHLPLLAVAVSITGAASYAAALAAFGRFQPSMFIEDVTAMSAGDFLGCFAVILLVRLGIASRKNRD